MTVKISQPKITKLLKYFFAGLTQPIIAQKLGIDQSSVSLYVKRFGERAAMIGLLKAAKEYNVYKEVSELRNLSVELQQLNLTTGDSLDGVRIIKDFNRLGVPREQHIELIQVCKRIINPGFIKASMKLVRIEITDKLSYEEAITKYQATLSKLPLKQNELSRTQAQLNSLNRSVADKEQELNNANAQLKQVREKARVEREDLEQDYKDKRQQLQVKQEEVETVAQVKAELKKDDLDIETFAMIVKEYQNGTQRVQGMLVRRDIEKHHSLGKTLELLTSEVEIKNQESTRLSNKHLEINQDNDRLITQTQENLKKYKDSSLELKQLLNKFNIYSRQYELFQGFLAFLLGSPSANGPIESLIATLQRIVRVWWYSSASMEEKRGYFMKHVFGDFLQSYRCDHCGGSRFMVSRGTDKTYAYSRPHCPVCHTPFWVKPDDSFLRAMVSEEQLKDIHMVEELAGTTVQLAKDKAILKPFQVLIDIPCEVCHQPIKDWTEAKVKEFATGLGWAHEKCRNTFMGKIVQLASASKYIPKIEEKPSLPKEEETKNPPGIQMRVDS